MDKEISSTAAKWQQELASGGYENSIRNWKEFVRFTRLSRTWEYILNATNLKPGASIFEFGCGGGNQLVPLALRGYRCFGIDCSGDVLERCKSFVVDVEKFSGKSLGVQLICGDFLSFDSQKQFDLVFNFGVIEHFTNGIERDSAVRKMFSLCKPGGYVISVVPSGQHPLRERMRRERLGGYNIPEIDYTYELMSSEMLSAGAQTVNVMPFNLFAYLLIIPATPILRMLRKLYYYSWQLVPVSLLPRRFASRHAFGLIGIGRKPDRKAPILATY